MKSLSLPVTSKEVVHPACILQDHPQQSGSDLVFEPNGATADDAKGYGCGIVKKEGDRGGFGIDRNDISGQELSIDTEFLALV